MDGSHLLSCEHADSGGGPARFGYVPWRCSSERGEREPVEVFVLFEVGVGDEKERVQFGCVTRLDRVVPDL